VAVRGAGAQLQRLAGFEDLAAGSDLQAFDGRVGLLRAGGAGGDPGEQLLVSAVVGAEELAALVDGPAARLGEQRAGGRVGETDAPAGKLARDPGVVLLRGVVAQRQSETILPRALAVASALIAAEARQDGDHVVEE